jgi:hypothetical protein
MSQDYADARFGVNKVIAAFPTTAALNGTVAATTLATKLVPYKHALNKVTVRLPIGGTEASLRQLIIGTASMFAAGTLGAVGAIGTIALGTLANETDVQAALSGTVQAGDVIVLQHLGTGAAVYTANVDVWGNEVFANL